jgi:hypothetical protein
MQYTVIYLSYYSRNLRLCVRELKAHVLRYYSGWQIKTLKK